MDPHLNDPVPYTFGNWKHLLRFDNGFANMVKYKDDYHTFSRVKLCYNTIKSDKLILERTPTYHHRVTPN